VKNISPLQDPDDEALTPEGMLKMTAASDPVLAEIWDNEKDAAYDRV
jgi:hypothetical protein